MLEPEGAIVDRIDLALARMAERGMKVRSINLNDKDLKALTKAMTQAWRKATGSKARVHPCSFREHPIYRDHEVRVSKHSKIWSIHGVSIDVPLRLPAKVPA